MITIMKKLMLKYVENEILINDEGKTGLGRETPLRETGQPTCSLWNHLGESNLKNIIEMHVLLSSYCFCSPLATQLFSAVPTVQLWNLNLN